MKQKTKKYFMEFYGNEFILCGETEITKKRYEELLLNGKRLEQDTQGEEFYVDVSTYHNETDSLVRTTTFISTSTTDLVLHKLECKEGYCFKK